MNSTLSADIEGLYLVQLTTKTELAKIMQVSRTSIIFWDDIATRKVDDYLLNYKVINGKRDTQSPLTPYQSWVVSRIQIVMKALKKADRVEAYIDERPEFFSLNTYQNGLNSQGATAA